MRRAFLPFLPFQTKLSQSAVDALALALAEQRQILVLDEWAADQDPETRKRFYQELLPEFRKMGLTVLAVTHDEHYFKHCDRRVHMAEGRLSTISEVKK